MDEGRLPFSAESPIRRPAPLDGLLSADGEGVDVEEERRQFGAVVEVRRISPDQLGAPHFAVSAPAREVEQQGRRDSDARDDGLRCPLHTLILHHGPGVGGRS